MCLRLQTTDTDAARLTIELNPFIQKVSMSSAEPRNTAINKAAVRFENRLNGFKKVKDNE